ncbi:glycosyltransferase [bacterium]|nr:glycosyltransferase [bacterium]
MRIAINTRFLLHGQLEGIGTFSHEVLQRLVLQHPEHQFIFLFDRPWHPSFIYAQNVEPHRIFPPARHPFLFVWWFEFSLPRILKKTKADLFFSPDAYLSLRSPVPQIPVFHDLAFEHYPGDVPLLASKHYRYFFPRYAQKAARILTVSQFSKNDIMETYGIDPLKIEVVYNGANEAYKPLSQAAIQAVKDEFSGGSDYFLYVGALHQRKNITRLLKAFLLYLQRCEAAGKQALKLLIVGRKAWGNSEMEAVYEQHAELQNAVSFTGRLPLQQLCRLMASAWYHVNVSYFEGFGIPILESMKCGVPVITSKNTPMVEVATDAALQVDPFEVESIASALWRATTDHKQRDSLAGKSLTRAADFSWDKTANLVWKNILELADNKGIK